MARDVTIKCDRCRGVIESGGSVLAPEAGPLRRRRDTPYDLCRPCSDDFLRWLAASAPIVCAHALTPTLGPA